MTALAARMRREADGASVVLELHDGRGHRGLGEASPLAGRSHETADACAASLRTIAGELRLASDGAASDRVIAAMAPFDAALERLPAARFALETALFDLLGHVLGRSIAELLGGDRPYRSVPVNGLLRMAEVDGTPGLISAGQGLVASGFSALKVKLTPAAPSDAAFEADVHALFALRAALPDVELRVDVNAGWAPEVARARLAALAPLGLRYVEQPVLPADIDCLAGAPVPWAADEALEDPALAEGLLVAGSCAAFVLKPTLLGGLLRARALAERALARGIAVVVTHAFEGPVALAAACELSLSLSRPPLASGLAPHARLAAHPRLIVRQLATAGLCRAVDAPGLGFS